MKGASVANSVMLRYHAAAKAGCDQQVADSKQTSAIIEESKSNTINGLFTHVRPSSNS